MSYSISRDALVATFPKALPAPAMLLDFAEFLGRVPHGGLGYFDELTGEPLGEIFPGDGVVPAITEKVGTFLHLPDGSWLGLWDYGGSEPAVVKLDSEGQHQNVAPTLGAFLVALSLGTTGVGELDDADGGSHRGELASWLEGRVPAEALAVDAALVPYFDDWYDALLAGREVPRPIWTAGGSSFDMANFSTTVASLVGRGLYDAKILSWLRALGPLARTKLGSSIYFGDKSRGFSLSFQSVDGNVKLVGCFFYGDGEGGYETFSSPLPRGITWTDSSTTLASRLGAPTHEIRNKKTGRLTSQDWGDRNPVTPYVQARYKDDGARTAGVFVGILPK